MANTDSVSTPEDVKAETVPLPDEAKDDAEPDTDTRCFIVYNDEDGKRQRVPLSEYDAAAH